MSAIIERGAAIAVVAPSGIVKAEQFEEGLKILRDAGYDMQPLPRMVLPHRYLAGTDLHRLAQLKQALTSPDFAAVWIARGGYGLTRLLGQIDFRSLPRRPVIGFSDVTCLLTALHAAGRGPAIHGPVVHSLPKTDRKSIRHLFELLDGRADAELSGVQWCPGTAEGPLVGGNLCLIAATCGTPWQLDARGCILVLEEVGELPYRVDRMLQQIDSAGVLDGVVGVAVGELVNCGPGPWGASAAQVITDHLARRAIPVVGELPIGHGAANRAFVVGTPARLHQGRLSWNCSVVIRS